MAFAWEPAPVVGGAYSDDTKPWSVQDTVNWIPVRIERDGGRSDSMLRTAPGASVFCIPGPVAPVRGLHDVEGKLFAVVGTSLFQITPKGVAIPRGTIPGTGRVTMAHNQITGGNEVAIANGTGGYVYNTATEVLAQITDDGFPGFKVCDYVDSYIVGVEPQGRYWFTSELADATSYNTLDRAEAESQPDLIVSLVVSHREVILLGERTVEFFRNTGAATGTFQRADGTEMEIGCASTHSVCKLDNSVFWLGNDGSVYRLNGYQPQRISTRPLEQAISRCNMAAAFAFTYEDRGHKIYYLTFPDGMTWGFDVSTGEWARRQSFGMDRWRMNCMVRWNNQWIAGDFANGKLYRLDWNMPWENGEIIEKRRITGVLHGNQNRLTLDAVEFVFDTGAEDIGPGDLSPGQPDGPGISGDAPNALVGDDYSYSYTLTPGDAPIFNVAISSGELPEGVTLGSDGVLDGSITSDIEAGTSKTYSYTVRAVDLNGLWAEIEDQIIVAAGVACGDAAAFDGGESFPSEFDVLLGSDTGEITLRFCPGGLPDKVEVWFDGAKVIDTGYIGNVSEQANLDAELASRGLPSETITQRTGTQSPDAFADWDAGEWDEFSFTKSTATAIATIKVFAPMDTTLWKLALSCPGGFP